MIRASGFNTNSKLTGRALETRLRALQRCERHRAALLLLLQTAFATIAKRELPRNVKHSFNKYELTWVFDVVCFKCSMHI